MTIRYLLLYLFFISLNTSIAEALEVVSSNGELSAHLDMVGVGTGQQYHLSITKRGEAPSVIWTRAIDDTKRQTNNQDGDSSNTLLDLREVRRDDEYFAAIFDQGNGNQLVLRVPLAVPENCDEHYFFTITVQTYE